MTRNAHTAPALYKEREENHMIIRMNAPLMVIGKSTQQGKKDNTVTYYYVTCVQGEDEAGKIRVANTDVFNRIEKNKQQDFTFEFNDQYSSFSVVDVAPMPDPDTTPDTAADTAPDTAADKPDTTTADKPNTATADKPDKSPNTGKTDKKN